MLVEVTARILVLTGVMILVEVTARMPVLTGMVILVDVTARILVLTGVAIDARTSSRSVNGSRDTYLRVQTAGAIQDIT